MAVVCLGVHAVVFLAVVVQDGESCRLALLQAVDGDGVSLDRAGNVVVEVAEMNTWQRGAVVLTGQLKGAEIGLLLGGHVVVLPDGRLVNGGEVGVHTVGAVTEAVVLFVENQNIKLSSV